MNQAQQPPGKSIFNWLGAGLLALLVIGLVYLTTRSRPAVEPGASSPLSSSPSAPLSPLTVALDSPLRAEPPPATASPSPSPTPVALPTASPEPSEALQLTVLHTNDTWGYLWPCG
jgi:2',3'-cyclic-nucleotide 2'-phosphodiesterase (5'-nucleotidase family)